MQKLSSKEKLGHLTISGNIQSILNGTVDESLLHSVGPHQFFFALGSGTFSDIEAIGETLIVNGRPFVSAMKGKKIHTESQSKVLSPFLVGIDNKQAKGTMLIYKPMPSPTLHMFYQDLILDYPNGLALIGLVKFRELYSTYLTKSPIYGENILENPTDYFAKIQLDKQKNACVFAVILSKEAAKNYPYETLQKVFYENPLETHTSTFYSHTHCGFLSSTEMDLPQNYEDYMNVLGKIHPTAIRHLLTTSSVEEGSFALFPI